MSDELNATEEASALSLALSIIHASAGDPKRAQEGAILIELAISSAIGAERERCARMTEMAGECALADQMRSGK